MLSFNAIMHMSTLIQGDGIHYASDRHTYKYELLSYECIYLYAFMYGESYRNAKRPKHV